MAASVKANGNTFYLKMLLVLVFMLGFGLLPPIGGITPYGMKVLGIFMGCIIGWGFGQQVITSILAITLLGFTEGASIMQVFVGAFGNYSLLMVLFALLFCYGIEQTGIMQFVANFILSRKFATKGPWMISLAFWISCCLCSALITNCLPVIILMWSMFYEVVEKMQVPKNDKWVQITMIMMCVVGYTGSVIMPYAGWPLTCYSIAQSAVEGLKINLFAHTVTVLIINVVILAVIFGISRFLLGREVKHQKIDNIVNSDDLKITSEQTIGFIILALLAVMMFLPNVAPATNKVIAVLANLGAVGCFAILTVVLAVVQVKGKPLMDPMAALKNLPWGLYFLLSAALYLAGLLTSPTTGISATILGALNGMIGSLGPVGIMIIFVGFGCLVTNAINNVVCINIFIPIGAMMLSNLGGNVNILTALLAVVLYLGLILPSGSVVGALMHGNSEWLQTKAIYQYAFLGCLIVVVVCLVVGIPVGLLLF